MSASGENVTLPSFRQVAVARAYVQGLEADRERLHKLEQTVNEQVWEIVKLGSYCRALQRALSRFSTDLDRGKYDPLLREHIDTLLDDAAELYEQVFTCPCGHSKWDHDKEGCQYLGCKPICGETE